VPQLKTASLSPSAKSHRGQLQEFLGTCAPALRGVAGVHAEVADRILITAGTSRNKVANSVPPAVTLRRPSSVARSGAWQAVGMERIHAPQPGETSFAGSLPSELRRPLGPRDPGDAWVEGDRGRFWGRFGSAGLLVHDPSKGVLLQHRALWSDHGGTWGLPGGALHQGEEAIDGALREAKEEAAVPPENVRVLFTSVFDVGYWTYTTVVAETLMPFDPAISDPESLELQWVPLEGVRDKALHPGFGASWPGLHRRLLNLPDGP